MATKCPKCHSDNPETVKFCGECGTQLIPSEGPRVSKTLTLETQAEGLTRGTTFAGRYEILEALGTGGMGAVYRVYDRKLEEEAALKLIKPEIAASRKSIERFKNELKVARKIAHKSVCKMYDLGESEGASYITMEYVPGEDLRSFIRRSKQLTVATSVSIARQVAEGLSEAHRLGIVHRDLKPGNIMIDKDGNAKIMDFGIARTLAAAGTTAEGAIIGTPEYMSPEQVEGKDVDERSDIYSLGVVLYEMVTGRCPFEGETPLSVAHKHKYETPEDPRKLVAEISEDLARTILKCLEKDKADRHESARALDVDLAKIEEGLATTEKALPQKKDVTERSITVTFNFRKLFAPVLIVLAAVVAAIILVKAIGGRKAISVVPLSSGKPSVAVMYFDNQTEKPGLDRMVVTLLTTNLSRNEAIEVTSTQRLFDILKLLGKQDAQTIDRSLATDVATRAGVKTMLLGSIIQIGGRIRLASELIDVKTGSIIGTQSEDGAKYEDLFAMVDGITEQVGKQFGGGTAAGRLKVADVTTSSLEALDQYQKGLDLMMRFDNALAVDFLRRAVEIDPRFAMAYAYLSMAQLEYMITVFDPYADLTEAKNTLELAKKYSGRATASERIVIQMIEALLNRDLTRAAGFGRELLAKNIPDKWAYLSITNEQWRKKDYLGAIQTAEKALENDPTDGSVYNSIAYSYCWLNDYPAAISALKKYFAVQPDVANAYDSAWELSMWAGQFDEAIRYADKALRVHPALGWPDHLAGWALIHKGEGEAARERFRRLERNFPSWRPTAAFDLGLSYLSEGRHREAQTEFRRALGLARENGQKRDAMMWGIYLGESLSIQGNVGQALAQFEEAEKASARYYLHDFNPVHLTRRFYAGKAFLRQGQIDQATSTAEEISKIVKEQGLPAEFLDFRLLLQAEIDLAQNKPEDALRILGQTSHYGWYSSPQFWRAKAAAEEASGQWDVAAECYGNFLGNIALARENFCDPVRYFFELSLADYNLGRIAEKTEDLAAAKDRYGKFLERMRAADPGFPEVRDARKRLAGLK